MNQIEIKINDPHKQENLKLLHEQVSAIKNDILSVYDSIKLDIG